MVWCSVYWRIASSHSHIDTSSSSAPPASTGFGSCGVAGVHSTRSQQRHSSTHSCRHASITATLFWRVRQKWRLTSFNECWMLQLVWSPAHTSFIEDCRGYCTPNCTGSKCLSESCTSSASWCTVAAPHKSCYGCLKSCEFSHPVQAEPDHQTLYGAF